MNAPTLPVRPLSALLGAEVSGIDLSTSLTGEVRDAIHRAFLHHQLLVFPGQRLDKSAQVRFTEHFGELERHANRNRGSDDFPLVHVVSNLDGNGRPGTVNSTRWHTDKSFRPAPSMATVLHGIEMPATGGDTCFASMYAAYEALPMDQRRRIDGLRVVHSWEHSRDNIGRFVSEKEKRDAPPMSHPLARVHPETGRRCLFLGMHAAYIEGMDFEAGRALIESLEAHATGERFVYRHRWRPGDVLMWDNRCLLHRADPNFDFQTTVRVLHRTCLRGTPTEGQAVAAPPRMATSDPT